MASTAATIKVKKRRIPSKKCGAIDVRYVRYFMVYNSWKKRSDRGMVS